jgi:hypothetical protein
MMIDLSKATPRPWSFSRDDCTECRRQGTAEYVIDGPPGGYHGQFSNGADAALIVEAVNAFDPNREEHIRELVAAARRARNTLVVAVREECGDMLDADAITALDAALAHFPEEER